MVEPLSADVVIVGSGVAGGLIANELVAAGLSVIILEAGPRVERGKIVENYRCSPMKNDFEAPYPPSALAPHPQYNPANDYLILRGPNASAYAQQYIRYLGGTTWHWAACAWRQMPSDFKLFSTYGVGRDSPFPMLTWNHIIIARKLSLAFRGRKLLTFNRHPSGRPPIRWRQFPTAIMIQCSHVLPPPPGTPMSRSLWPVIRNYMPAVRNAAAIIIACRSARSVRCIVPMSM